ncbi:MAG: hypothetical protein QNK33_08460 [Bacteroidales bacterium]|nr:hypothetical protein [Bacteroidales bacterium]
MKVLRIVSIISILVFTIPSVFSQDTIVRTNGTKISANIFKAEPSQISYYKYSDPTQTLYFLSTKYVLRIVFRDGTIKEYSAELEEEDYSSVPPNKRVLNFSPLDLYFGNIYVRYEKLQGNGNIGLFIGGAVNISPKEIRYQVEDDYNNLEDYGYSLVKTYAYIETGLNLYTPKFGPFIYGSGTSFILALYKTHIYDTYYDDSPEPGARLTFKWMWINQVRINLSESVQMYIEGDLSIAPRFFTTSIVHLGFSLSF